MRGSTRETWAAGLAVVALMAGLTGCSGGGDGDGKAAAVKTSAPAVAKACAGGTFTWSGVKKTEKLTGFSGVQTLGKGGGPLSGPLTRVYTPRVSVKVSGPAVSSAEVLFSLGKKAGVIESDAPTLAEEGGDASGFTDVHAKAPSLDGDSTTVEGAGETVKYKGVREVTGDFTYTCPGGTTTKGHARSWQEDITGVLDCQESVGHSGIAREAARHSCEPGSPATRNA